MSIPPQYATTRNVSEPLEDCRDFLRTGRCKYGASCKYNHPANVQSGGGMKTPLDPSEPLYPLRPNEPVCVYYMKHGTCKFAQKCKFHHPPQTSQHASLNSGSVPVVMMNAGRPHESPQLVLNQIDGAGNSSMMLQFLPQRPDEPDCIYFLKNGRCKYGATCRYHHPLNYHQRRAEEQRRHREQRRNHLTPDRYSQPVHYVTQPVAGLPQGPVYVADNPVALVNVDREGTQSYQQFSIVPGADGTSSYCVPVGSTVGTTEQGSSTSSIASSFDTAVSNHDHLHGDGVGGLWTRRSASGNSLSAHAPGDSRGQTSRVVLPHSASDGSIARRSRTSSYGSSSDNTTFYDAAGPRMRRNGSSGSWRVPVDRGSPFEHAQGSPHQYRQRLDSNEIKAGESRRSRPPGLGGPPNRRVIRRGPRPREGGDEGFTMMTSALLNMLDTPEELPSEAYSDEDMYQAPPPQYPNTVGHEVDPAMFERLSLQPVPPGGGYVPRPDGGAQSWSPTWQGASTGGQVDNNSQVMQMMHPRQQQGAPASGPHDQDVGLYLP